MIRAKGLEKKGSGGAKSCSARLSRLGMKFGHREESHGRGAGIFREEEPRVLDWHCSYEDRELCEGRRDKKTQGHRGGFRSLIVMEDGGGETDDIKDPSPGLRLAAKRSCGG